MDRKVISWRGMAVFAAILVAIFGVTMYGVLRSRHAMQEQYALQHQQIVSMELDVSELKNELARVGTDGYVENEAREKYDYVKAGEMRFEFSDPQKLQNYTAAEWQVILDEKLY